jgi:hypothetical protein
MATSKQKWLLGFGVVAVIALVAVITNLRTPPATPATANENPPPGCQTNADCPPENACVVPGRCSRSCKTDSDCTAGRRCGELRAMQPGPGGAPTTVTTCVRATPVN